uniref:Uncharacterized protein ycf34 n=1 Tax=Ectocarpus siliculosus TaxID=2880 RepID=D1J7C1_ECTSI|nr:Chloroplast conserved hypothetical protein [Ectocarpus siliculosus]CAT18857.1 Chloroplast conserved hypothetical protein [Ectocarpus siliculosus]CAV31305.1 Chloroplast conserved hypothetical protein [Ectocarpus siliculosus]
MCICLNCDRINSCHIYFLIEKQHQETKKDVEKSFSPQAPVLLCLNFFSKQGIYLLEWDVNECLSYQEKPGNWLGYQQKNLNLSSYLVFDLLF